MIILDMDSARCVGTTHFAHCHAMVPGCLPHGCCYTARKHLTAGEGPLEQQHKAETRTSEGKRAEEESFGVQGRVRRGRRHRVVLAERKRFKKGLLGS